MSTLIADVYLLLSCLPTSHTTVHAVPHTAVPILVISLSGKTFEKKGLIPQMDSAQIVIFVFVTIIINNMGKGTHFFQTAGIWTANKIA